MLMKTAVFRRKQSQIESQIYPNPCLTVKNRYGIITPFLLT